jgi:hypothetical protein
MHPSKGYYNCIILSRDFFSYYSKKVFLFLKKRTAAMVGTENFKNQRYQEDGFIRGVLSLAAAAASAFFYQEQGNENSCEEQYEP